MRGLDEWVRLHEEAIARIPEVLTPSAIAPWLQYGKLFKNWTRVVKVAKSVD